MRLVGSFLAAVASAVTACAAHAACGPIRDLEVAVNPPAAQAQNPCPGVRIQADLVVVDRRIVVASNLSNTSCLLGIALDHYRLHATAAQVALREFASGLPAAIAPEVDRYVRGRPDMPRDGDRDLRAFVDALLDRAVAEFSANLPEAQAKVDFPEEVRTLTTPCGAT